jgi:hypothetical protein
MAGFRETIAVTALLTSHQIVEDGIIFHERTPVDKPRRRQIINEPTFALIEAFYPPPKSMLEIGIERLKKLRRPNTSPAFLVESTSR